MIFNIFGPTHSGKSTLAGLIKTHGMSEEEFSRQERRNKRTVEQEGHHYNTDMRLSYFVDKSKDEHERHDHNDSPGTSKHRHYVTLVKPTPNIKEVMMIDAPGTDRNWRSALYGLSWSDVGIYMIEAVDAYRIAFHDVSDEEYPKLYNKIFDPLIYWTHAKANALSSLIIVLSKIDGESTNFNRIVIKRAMDFIHTVSPFSNVPIIPISIDVRTRNSYHVFEDSSRLPWYEGSSLMEFLEKRAAPYSYKIEPFYACIETMRRPQYQGNDVLRMKVLRGGVSVNDEVILGPLRLKNDVELSFLHAKVKSLRRQNEIENTNALDTESIGGVAFDALYANSKKSYSLDEVTLTRLTVLFSPRQIQKGNLLSVYIEPAKQLDRELMTTMKLRTSISLVWFGKLVDVTIAGFHKKRQGYIYYLYKLPISSDDLFVIPTNDDRKRPYRNDRYVLQFPSKQSLPVQLTGVYTMDDEEGYSIEFRFSYPYQMKNDELKLNLYRHGITEFVSGDQEYQVIYTKINARNFMDILGVIRTFVRAYSLERDYQVYINKVT